MLSKCTLFSETFFYYRFSIHKIPATMSAAARARTNVPGKQIFRIRHGCAAAHAYRRKEVTCSGEECVQLGWVEQVRMLNRKVSFTSYLHVTTGGDSGCTDAVPINQRSVCHRRLITFETILYFKENQQLREVQKSQDKREVILP